MAEHRRCDPFDFSKLDTRDGVIHYQLYGQDGRLTRMTVQDTYEMRIFVSQVQITDRYVSGPEWREGRVEKPSRRNQEDVA